MNSKQLIKKLKNDGWIPEKRKGTAHIQFTHPVKKGKVTVSDHGTKEVPPGTLNAILKQAGLK